MKFTPADYEEKIRADGAAIRAMAARAVEREQEHARDLAAARAITERLRSALCEGATDAAQTRALHAARCSAEGAFLPVDLVRGMAGALLALHEETKALRSQLAEVRAAAGEGSAL